MVLIMIPITAWSKQGTGIAWSDLWNVTKRPLLAGLLAGAIAFGAKFCLGSDLPPILVLTLGVGIVLAVYACALVAMGQKTMYLDLLTELFRKTHSKQ
jgi:hypothetical protein